MPSLLLLFVLALLTVSSQSYSRTMQYRCKFDTSSSPDRLSNEGFSIEYSVDIGASEVYIAGNNTASKVILHMGLSGLSFVEVFSSGAAQSTTIDNFSNIVQSRNIILLDRIMPSQYYGKCE
jgi:hypothetical protein